MPDTSSGQTPSSIGASTGSGPAPAAAPTPAPSVVVPVPNGLNQILATFGDLRPFIQDDGTLSTNWEIEQMTRSVLPFGIPLSGNPGAIVTKIECHHLLSAVFLQVFNKIAEAGLQSKITSYGGCYAGRAKRTSTHWSAHAWGIAIDLNVATNQQGTKGDMDPGVIEVFRSFGFKWGGEFSGASIDPMHFQYCTGY
jgi:hypothetical protein